MKVVAFSASPRQGGNTELAVERVLAGLKQACVETEHIRLYGYEIRPCTACKFCQGVEDCPLEDDLLPLYRQARAADGLLLASPVYFSGVTSPMKAFMDRAGYIAMNNGNAFRRKVGGGLSVAARSGANFTDAQFLLWFMILGMIVPGSSGWNSVYGNSIGEAMQDREGLEILDDFTGNFTWLLARLGGDR